MALLGGVAVQSHCLAHKALVLVVGSEVEHGRRVPRLGCRLQMRNGRLHVDAHAAAAQKRQREVVVRFGYSARRSAFQPL